MSPGFLSVEEVAVRFGVSRSTIWRWLQSNPTFPAPVALSPGCTRWRLVDLQCWEVAKGGRSHGPA